MIEVYATKQPFLDECPIIIICSCVKENTITYESYIFMNDERYTLLALRDKQRTFRDADSGFVLDEQFVRDGIFNQIQQELNVWQFNRYLKNQYTLFISNRYVLVSDINGLNTVTRMRIRGNNVDHLKNIMKITENDELRNYLQMILKIDEVQKIKISKYI